MKTIKYNSIHELFNSFGVNRDNLNKTVSKTIEINAEKNTYHLELYLDEVYLSGLFFSATISLHSNSNGKITKELLCILHNEEFYKRFDMEMQHVVVEEKLLKQFFHNIDNLKK